MRSRSAPEYRKCCAALIAEAVKRPSMFYNELWELELILDGHWMAFEQIAGLERSMTFKSCFSEWLYASRSVSCSAGWAYAVTNLAKEMNCDYSADRKSVV